MDTMKDIDVLVAQLGEALQERGMFASTAESCTGGLIANTLTNVAGSSQWFLGSVVAYANEVKMKLLGVPESVLAEHGAVSRQTVEAMAPGVCRAIGAEAGVAVSGVAGPGGGSPEKPVGTVWIGWCVRGVVDAQVFTFSGNRDAVKAQTTRRAIEGLLARVKSA